jgi:hypothetical protein
MAHLVTDCERDCEGGEDSCRRWILERIPRDEAVASTFRDGADRARGV